MVASSQQAAKNLVKRCEFGRDATRANNGVLIGKGDTHVIMREEALSINSWLLNNFEIRETPHMATRYKSASLPMHNVSCAGTVCKTGNEVSVLQGHYELIVKIIHFYHICVQNQHISIATGDKYERSNDGNGATLRHPLSDSVIVHPLRLIFVCF